MVNSGVQRLKAGVDVAVCSLMREVGDSLQLTIERETQAAAAHLVLDKILRSAEDLGRPSHNRARGIKFIIILYLKIMWG
jgi:hypothetical protein